MKNLIIGAIIGVVIGFGAFSVTHKQTGLDLNAAVNSGGLTIDR